MGRSERISQDQWQPRDMKTGRVQKYVKFDPTKQDNEFFVVLLIKLLPEVKLDKLLVLLHLLSLPLMVL